MTIKKSWFILKVDIGGKIERAKLLYLATLAKITHLDH